MVVPTCDRPDLLVRCLAALAASTWRQAWTGRWWWMTAARARCSPACWRRPGPCRYFFELPEGQRARVLAGFRTPQEFFRQSYYRRTLGLPPARDGDLADAQTLEEILRSLDEAA